MNTDPRLNDPTFLFEQDARLRALARRLVHDAALADDVVQDTWTQALLSSRTVDSRMPTWLSGIARVIAFSKRREHARRSRREAGSEPPSPLPSTEELLAREAARRAVADAVMQLAEPARAVIVLRFFDDLSSRKIAARLDVPVETVRTRIKRALEQLRRELDRKHGGDGRAWCSALAPILAAKQTAAVGTLAVASVAAALFVGTLGVFTWSESLGALRRGEVPQMPVAVESARAPITGPADATAREPSLEAEPARVAAAPSTTQIATTSNISARVVDETGQPIVGAEVSMTVRDDRNRGPALALPVTLTQADGSFAFADVPTFGRPVDSAARGFVTIAHPRFVKHRGQLAKREGSIITLPIPKRLEGVISDAATRLPVASVPVALQQHGVGFEVIAGRRSLAQTTTDGAGRYAFLVLPRTVLAVVVSRPNCIPIVANVTTVTGEVTTFDIALPATRAVTFDVRALASGAPLGNIEILDMDDRVDGVHPPVGMTDAHGRLRLEGVPRSNWEACVFDRARDFGMNVSIPAAADGASETPVSLRIPEPWVVKGVLVDPGGSAFAGSVTVEWDQTRGIIKGGALSRVLGPALGGVTVMYANPAPTVNAAADGSFVLPVPLCGVDRVRILASRGESLTKHLVAIIDAPTPQSQHDVGKATVTKGAMLTIDVRSGPARSGGATIDAQLGTTHVTWNCESGYLEVDDLAPGRWSLTASIPGIGSSPPVMVRLVEDMTTSTTLKVASAVDDIVVTRGRVVDADGAPVGNLNLLARQRIGTNELAGVSARDPTAPKPGDHEHYVRVDAQGNFALETPRAFTEDLHFRLSLTGYVTAAIATPGSSNVLIRMPRVVAFRLRLVDEGGTPLDAPIVIEWKDGDTYRPVPVGTNVGLLPDPTGILEFSWPEGPASLRVVRRSRPEAPGATPVLVDLDVHANDEATAPTIVVP